MSFFRRLLNRITSRRTLPPARDSPPEHPEHPEVIRASTRYRLTPSHPLADLEPEEANLQILAFKLQRPADSLRPIVKRVGLKILNDQVDRWNLLSPREQEIVSCLYANLTTDEIATRLNIAPGTVRAHIYHCQTKLNLPSKEALIFEIKSWHADVLPMSL